MSFFIIWLGCGTVSTLTLYIYFRKHAVPNIAVYNIPPNIREIVMLIVLILTFVLGIFLIPLTLLIALILRIKRSYALAKEIINKKI